MRFGLILLLGLVFAAGLGLAAQVIARDTVALPVASIEAGEGLAPVETRVATTSRARTTTARTTARTTTGVTTTTSTETEPGDDHGRGRGRGRNRGRGGGDD
ncbi:MAG TPA: hypothetical protein VGU26_06475 [Gaiellaceae bacterium]|nr:hypothetical protein [Gaiellaceae bacterium]